ncbi:MAG: hypothetical protein BYD32DRAFT_412816, partial [Podila humilis]
EDTTNYTQCEQEHCEHEAEENLPGDLFFLSIRSTPMWMYDVGNESFIHNPEDGPYTPVHSSTPLYTGGNGSNGYQTPTGPGSPHSHQSESRASTPCASQVPQERPQTTSTAQLMDKCNAPTPAVNPAIKIYYQEALEHTRFSLKAAEADQDYWYKRCQDPSLSSETLHEMDARLKDSLLLVHYYTTAIFLLEAPEPISMV